MRDCLERDQILALIADSTAVDADVRAHAERCSHCRERIAEASAAVQFAAMWNDFRTSPGDDVLPASAARILENLQPYFDEVVSSPDVCPDERTLLDLVLEPQSISECVRGHVAHCKSCQQTTAMFWREYETVLEDDEDPQDPPEAAPIEAHTRVFSAATKLYREQVKGNASCPRHNELLSMLAGDSESGEIHEHLQQCEQCQQFLSKSFGNCLLAGGIDSFFCSERETPPAKAVRTVWESLQPEFYATTPKTDPCPSHEQLLQHLNAPEEATDVGTHVQECKQCQESNSKSREVLELAAQLDAFQSESYGPVEDISVTATEVVYSSLTDQFFFIDRSSKVATVLRAMVPYASAACIAACLAVCGFLYQNARRERTLAFNQDPILSVPSAAVIVPEKSSQRGTHLAIPAFSFVTKSLQRVNELGELNKESELCVQVAKAHLKEGIQGMKSLIAELEADETMEDSLNLGRVETIAVLREVSEKLHRHDFEDAREQIESLNEEDLRTVGVTKEKLRDVVLREEFDRSTVLLRAAFQNVNVDEVISKFKGQMANTIESDLEEKSSEQRSHHVNSDEANEQQPSSARHERS